MVGLWHSVTDQPRGGHGRHGRKTPQWEHAAGEVAPGGVESVAPVGRVTLASGGGGEPVGGRAARGELARLRQRALALDFGKRRIRRSWSRGIRGAAGHPNPRSHDVVPVLYRGISLAAENRMLKNGFARPEPLVGDTWQFSGWSRVIVILVAGHRPTASTWAANRLLLLGLDVD